jgi:hypothetical protein
VHTLSFRPFLPVGRAHPTYTEPHPTRGTWTSPPRCQPDRATAEQLRDAITVLAGLDARRRRTWTIIACTCGAS